MSETSKAKTRVCAVIVTRDRRRLLQLCLESLERAARAARDIELSAMVVFNGENGSCLSSEALPVRTLVLDLPHTPAEARNRALESLRDLDFGPKDWVLCLDDDVQAIETLLTSFSERLAEFPIAAAFGGPNLTPESSNSFQRATGAVLASRFATFFSQARYRELGRARQARESDLMLCNLFVRASWLQRLRFRPGLLCAEENFLLEQIRVQGGQLIYCPSLRVFHERRPLFREFVKQVHKYGVGRGQCFKLTPHPIRVAHLIPSLSLIYGLFFLLVGAAPGNILSTTFALPFALYLLLWILATARAALGGSAREILWIALLFPTIHIAYGAGLISGLVRKDA